MTISETITKVGSSLTGKPVKSTDPRKKEIVSALLAAHGRATKATNVREKVRGVFQADLLVNTGKSGNGMWQNAGRYEIDLSTVTHLT